MTHTAPPAGCCALLLAAGRGRRFGGDKMMALIEGQPLVLYPMRVLAQAAAEGLVSRILAVVPADTTELAALLRRHGAEVVSQPDPSADQAHSLGLGLAQATGAGSAMIVLGDQPRLQLNTLRQLLATAASNPDAMVRPRYADTPSVPGHPVVIPARWWHLNRAPAGFRNAAAAGVPHCFVPMPGANPDVDTPADLRSLPDMQG